MTNDELLRMKALEGGGNFKYCTDETFFQRLERVLTTSPFSKPQYKIAEEIIPANIYLSINGNQTFGVGTNHELTFNF